MRILHSLLIGILAVFFTAVVVNDYFHAGFPYTHDGENHLARFANYKTALREGQVPPRFAPNLMNHYGYPVFNYNYPLANIMSVPFSVIGFNYELTFKLLVASFVMTGLLGIRTWLKQQKFSLPAQVIGMTGFALSPYLLSSIVYRGNIGEIAALGLFPWLLVSIESLLSDKQKPNLIMILVWTAFLLSHNVSVLFGLVLIGMYAILRFRLHLSSWKKMIMVGMMAIGLSLWFWLPALAEKSLVVLDNASLSNEYANHFVSMRQLLFAPFLFGFSYPGNIDSLSFNIGLLQIVGVIIALLVFMKLFMHKKITAAHTVLIFSLVAALLLIILQLKLTSSLWSALPFVKFVQFPWRLSLFFAVFATPLLAISWEISHHNLKRLLIGLIIFQFLAFIRISPVSYFHKASSEYDSFGQSTTTANEDMPQTFTYLDFSDWLPTAKAMDGKATINIVKWSGSNREYTVTTDAPVTIVEPTMAFSGWETVIGYGDNDKKIAQFVDNEEVKGRLAYHLEPGIYTINSTFTQKTWARLLGNTISLCFVLLIIISILRRFLPKEWNFFIMWKASLIGIACIAPMFLLYKPSFPYADWLQRESRLPQSIYSWANFDGVHYLTIVEKGYVGTGLIQAFFPLYPIILRVTTLMGNNVVLTGLLLNTVFSACLLFAFKKLLAIDYDSHTAWLGSLILFLFPTAFYLHALYTEALFLLLVVLSFYFGRTQRWKLATLTVALASATRIVGVMLVPALLYELYVQNKHLPLSKWWKQGLMIASGSVGFLLYAVYLWKEFGNPLYFAQVQSKFGSGRQESLILFPQVVWRYVKIISTYRPFGLKYVAYIQEFVISLVGLVGLAISWFNVRQSYVIFSVLAFLIPPLTGNFSSMPRYALASFALFILLAQLLRKNRIWQVVYFTLSTILLVFNTILFIQGYWVA
jgi:Gpi18-like mannosyltransferase